MHSVETTYTTSGDSCFRTTADNGIGLTQTDEVECISNSIGRSGACRTSRIVRTMKTVQDRNLSGSNVRNHLRDEERIELRTVFFMESIVTCFFFKCTDSTNTGTKDDTDFVQILIFDIKTGIFYRLLGYADSVLSIQVHLASLFAVDILIGIKVLHFACELGLEK